MTDLTTLANVKAFLATGPNPDQPSEDPLIRRIITSASGWVEQYLNRKVAPAQLSWTTSGSFQNALILPNYPVISVDALMIDGVAIQPATGFLYDDRSLVLVGGSPFSRGVLNLKVTYTAGFLAKDEPWVIPATAPYEINAPSLARPWNSDWAVKFQTSGVALTKVSGAPAANQYKVAEDAGVMKYTFNAADAGKSILISYGYTPPELEEVVIELVAEKYKWRTRIGQTSVNLGGQSTTVVSFSTKDLNENAKTLLNQMRDVVPL